ncbi:MAG: putative toxin-antitoxin system toxin component, PIN family [Nanoarchaeota archaeon]
MNLLKFLKRDFLYNKEEIENILEKFLQFLTLINPTQQVDIIKEDIEDNKIIECAVESKADYILSYDKHLLNMKEYKGTKIIKPEEILYGNFS